MTLSEAALLAGLVKSPSKLAPTRNYDGAERRAQIVLAAMSDAGYVTDATRPRPRSQSRRRSSSRRAGGSINYVADWVMDVLDDVVGRVEQDIVVETTIDPTLQASAEKALLDELTPKGAKFDVEQGAMVVMTPQGAVRALVGGKNYAESQFNRAVAAKRQPGSAFKPFVYLDRAGARADARDTMREDKPIDVKGWKPENYTPRIFRAGVAHQGAGDVAQHRVGAPHPRSRAAGGGAHRAPARHRLEARTERLDRARHLGSLRDGAGVVLCAVRQRRHRGRAACRSTRCAPPAASSSTARAIPASAASSTSARSR